MEMEHSTDGQTHKKGRHRKKLLYTEILNQMEFYFSDANLSKDRFLGECIKADPFVELSVFIKFNKIRKLTTNIRHIVKAVSNSELLELSEDKTKVKRKLPLQIKDNVDGCTIYVERLKSDATHDWLTSIFSEFGKVVYVSIPKYRNSEIIKGFAFVEFESEESARKALEYFESIHCTIPSFMDPQNLCSISTFEPEEDKKQSIEGVKEEEEENDKMLIGHEEQETKDADEDNDSKNNIKEKSGETTVAMENKEEETSKKKRKHSNSVSKDEHKEKKWKNSTESDQGTVEKKRKQNRKEKREKNEPLSKKGQKDDNEDEEAKDEPVKKKVKIEDANEGKPNEDAEVKEESSEEEVEGKKKKKKKSYRKKVNLKEIGLQILSKKEWKKMRNKYLDLQKKTMKELKAHFNRQRFCNINYNKKQNGDEDIPKDEKNHEKSKPEETETKKQLIPGLIAKVTLNEPCENNKGLKTELKANAAGLQFIDIPLQVGSTEVYLRFVDAENAKTFSGSAYEKGKVQILEGDEEKQYWDKIAIARRAKTKKHEGKQRGRDKLLKKAEKEAAKHIRFDENE